MVRGRPDVTDLGSLGQPFRMMLVTRSGVHVFESPITSARGSPTRCCSSPEGAADAGWGCLRVVSVMSLSQSRGLPALPPTGPSRIPQTRAHTGGDGAAPRARPCPGPCEVPRGAPTGAAECQDRSHPAAPREPRGAPRRLWGQQGRGGRGGSTPAGESETAAGCLGPAAGAGGPHAPDLQRGGAPDAGPHGFSGGSREMMCAQALRKSLGGYACRGFCSL